MPHIDLALILPALLACVLGGLLKGATGAGAPVIGVPVLAALTDVQFAVAVFVTSNLLTNVNQAWRTAKPNCHGHSWYCLPAEVALERLSVRFFSPACRPIPCRLPWRWSSWAMSVSGS
ncbi:hypothetical protein [uncultured Roseibium sp.]|uniref:hypothetical protein n=1 Tax=uncultured Roseibium sp. TaxID=1936171 RepID=UPI0032175205